MSAIKEFSTDLGVYASSEKSKELVEKNKAEREKKGQKRKDHTQSQFFGRDKIEELLRNTGSACVGLKITLLLEGEEEKEGLLIQAVDKDGKVLGIKLKAGEMRSLGGWGDGIYGGPKCPRTCLPPPTDDQ